MRGRRNRDLTKMCHRGHWSWGFFEVLSDHGDEEEEDGESANETTEMMPPLPLGLWFLENRDVL